MNETVVFNLHQEILPPLELVIVQGPDEGRPFPVRPGRQTYGRSRENAIVLDDPTVSQKHGVIEYGKKGEVTVYDTASLNGISLSGKKEPVIPLKVGKKIQIGAVYLELRSQPAATRRPNWRRVIVRSGRSLPMIFTCAVIIPGFLFFLHGNTPSRVLTPIETVSLPQSPLFSPLPETHRTPTSYPRQTIGMIQAGEREREGEALFGQGRLQDAYLAWTEALSLDPQSEIARQGLKSLEQEAMRILEEGLMIRDSSPKRFREKMKMALAITDPSSTTGRRIRSASGEET